MSNAEILEKAIQKAISGGYKNPMGELSVDEKGAIFVWVKGFGDEKTLRAYGSGLSLRNLIYSHDFAKSFFGTNEVCFSCGLENKHDPYCAERTSYDEAWKYHLRDMVISPDPIQYLAENMEGKE